MPGCWCSPPRSSCARRAPMLAAAVALVVLTVLERLDTGVDEDLVGPFFTTLLLVYSVGAHTEGRRLLPASRCWSLGTALVDPARQAARRRRGLPLRGDDHRRRAAGARPADGLAGEAQPRAAREGGSRRGRARGARRRRGGGRARADRGRAAPPGAATRWRRWSGRRRPPRRSRARGPRTRSPAFTAVESTGREALGEIRGLLGVLRREDEELALAPQPSLAHLADLVARVRRVRAGGRARRRGRSRRAARGRRPHRLPRRAGGARRRAAGAGRPARGGARPLRRRASSTSRSPTSASRRRTASGRCSGCASASRSTAATWSPRRSTAPASPCARGCRWSVA